MVTIVSTMKVFVWFTLYSLATQVQGTQADSFKHTIINEITELKTRQNLCDAKVSNLEVTVNKLEDTVKELKDRNEKLENILVKISPEENYTIQSQDLTDELSTFQTKRRRMLTSGSVAFTVGVSSPDLTHLGEHNTIIFDQAITNFGNA